MSRIAKISVGECEITVLSDGGVEFPDEVFPELDGERLKGLLADAGKTAIETNFNAMHIRTGKDSILIDTGTGGNFGPTAGFMRQALTEAGIRPEDVTRLVFTHLHPDHVGGSVGSEGEPIFINAELILSETERRFWTDDSNFSGADDDALAWRRMALGALEGYGDRVTAVGSDSEIASGIHLVDLPGHTPGHVGVRIDSGGAQFLYAADILHAQDLQLAAPNLCAAFDADKDQARETRRRTLDMLATDGILFSGSHFLDRVIGHVERSGSGYRISKA